MLSRNAKDNFHALALYVIGNDFPYFHLSFGKSKEEEIAQYEIRTSPRSPCPDQ